MSNKKINYDKIMEFITANATDGLLRNDVLEQYLISTHEANRPGIITMIIKGLIKQKLIVKHNRYIKILGEINGKLFKRV